MHHVVIPSTSNVKQTYSDMALLFWKYILDKSKGIENVHVVFDRYKENSLKSQTREKHGERITVHTPSHIQGQMITHDWKKVLTSSKR